MSFIVLLLLEIISGIGFPGKSDQFTYREKDMISLSSALSINVQPVDQTDCKGNKVTFSVIAEGGLAPVHYQWQRKRPTDAGFTTFGAVDSTKLSVYNIGVGSEAPDGTLYRVVLTDQNSSVTSISAALRVNQITGIAPVGVASFTRNEGENLWFNVLSSGNTPSAYQWIKKQAPGNWTNLSDNSTISGSREEQLDFTKISLADSGIYKVRVTFPTINGNQCTETSSISRTVYVLPDTVPPTFVNLDNNEITLCPTNLELAEWNDELSDIMPARTTFYQLHKNSSLLDLSIVHFYDNLTSPADLVLHWGIFSVSAPINPIHDEAGVALDDHKGQISVYQYNIDFEAPASGKYSCQIIYWLEDTSGNMTHVANRYKVNVAIPLRPEIINNF